jgi:hypothetical protein
MHSKMIYNASGVNLVHGKVWKAEYVAFPSSFHDAIYGEVVDEEVMDRRQCQIDPEHITGKEVISISLDVYDGGSVGLFVPLSNHGYMIGTNHLLELLHQQAITGLVMKSVVRAGVNQSRHQHLSLSYVDVVGMGGECKRLQTVGDTNRCLHCGQVDMICKGCGLINNPCYRCGLPTVGDGSDVMFEDGTAGIVHVVESNEWDGSDVFTVSGDGGGLFVSSRFRTIVSDICPEFFEFSEALVSPSSTQALGEVITAVDCNGTARACSFDVVDRPTVDQVIALGSGVDGAVMRLETAYDSAGRPYLFTGYDGPKATRALAVQPGALGIRSDRAGRTVNAGRRRRRVKRWRGDFKDRPVPR